MTRSKQPWGAWSVRAALSAVLAGGAALPAAAGGEVLSGANEVPPITTSASGTADIIIKDDRTVGGSATTEGIQGTAAHIHQGAKGHNGPPIITLSKEPDGLWMVPSEAKLTAEQFKQYKAGDLYVNVHSAAHKDGEIRAQLRP